MIIFQVFIISFGVSMNSMAYSTFDTLFTINSISISFNRSNFTLAFFKAAYYANPGVERKWARSRSYISRYIFWKLLNTPTSSNASLYTYKSWYSSNFFISNPYKFFLYAFNMHQ